MTGSDREGSMIDLEQRNNTGDERTQNMKGMRGGVVDRLDYHYHFAALGRRRLSLRGDRPRDSTISKKTLRWHRIVGGLMVRPEVLANTRDLVRLFRRSGICVVCPALPLHSCRRIPFCPPLVLVPAVPSQSNNSSISGSGPAPASAVDIQGMIL